MDTKSHVGFWLCVFLVLFLTTPLMRNGTSMEAFVERELALTKMTFGEKTGTRLQKQAEKVFELYLPSGPLSGAIIKGKDMEITKKVVAGPGVGMTILFNSYVEGLVLNLFIVALRFFIFLVWFLVLLPVFIATVIDGFTQRAIKRAEFGAIRPAAYSVMGMIVVPMTMAPLIYLVVPMPVSPLVSPLWALLMVLPLSLMISNMQPIFGKN